MKPPGYQRIRMGNQLRVGNFLRQFIRIYAEDLAQASYSEVEEAPSSSIVNPKRFSLRSVPPFCNVPNSARSVFGNQKPAVWGPLHVGGILQTPGEGPHVNPPRPAADLDLLHFFEHLLYPLTG